VDWWSDLGNGVLKSFVFGLAVTFVALLEGYAAKPTPEGFPVPPPVPWSWLRWRCWAWTSCSPQPCSAFEAAQQIEVKNHAAKEK
jgi:hypothetical protein